MAELNQSAPTKGARKIRSKKLNATVDLTAMVDLAFLLITFFMLTTTLGKPKSIELTLPEASGEPTKFDENCTMTILIGADDKTYSYMGKSSDSPKEITLGNKGLRGELAARQKEALAYQAAKGITNNGLNVLIKPGKQSSYGNLVDVLDEMAIGHIKTFAIVDPDPKDADLLSAKK